MTSLMKKYNPKGPDNPTCPLLIEGSLADNMDRQYGQMKSRVGQRQREEKDQKREE